MFHIGDRVRLTVDNPDGHRDLLGGDEGTVCSLRCDSPNYDLCVEFDRRSEQGHNGSMFNYGNGPTCKDQHGWYVKFEQIELVEESEDISLSLDIKELFGA